MDDQGIMVTGTSVPQSVIDQICVLLGYDPTRVGDINIRANAPREVEVTTWPLLVTRDYPDGVRFLNDEKSHYVRAYVTHKIVSDSLVDGQESK